MESAKPDVAVIDYGMGNLRSVCKAWEHEGASVRIVESAKEIGDPAALILPGVGALGDCVAGLRESGLDTAVRGWIGEDRPFFAICLGMQALFEHSEEGDVAGLGVFAGRVRRFRLPDAFKIPHMGWNTVSFRKDTPVSADAGEGDQFYFVHSYKCEPEDADLAWGVTNYGGEFVSAVARGNCYATQFHPEKSQAKGLRLYRNFLDNLTGKTLSPV